MTRGDDADGSGADLTIYDVARHAGVSPSTVSRALSRPGRVSFETAEKVRRAAGELGYRSRTLQRDVSGDDGLIVMALADIGNPFYGPLVRGAQRAAEEAGHHLMLIDTHGSPEVEERLLERLVPVAKGMILTSARINDGAVRRLAKQRPVVVLNRVVTDVRSIVPDNARAVRRAAELLGELGHREITWLAGPELSWAAGMRWRGIVEAGQELSLKVRRLGPADPTMKGGAELFAQWQARSTSAVMAYNDLLALGFMAQAQRAGVRIPDDVSVVGFDNIVNGAQTTPSLTTLAAPLPAMGSAAVQNLLNPPREPGTPPTVHLPVRLVVRGSVGPVAGSGPRT
ncbi:LacI family DNA-binding transcriptional regulator [Mariniluteicoccus endophyticus]